MSGKFSFNLVSEDKARPFPSKIIIGQQAAETIAHVALKLLSFALFYRDRLQMEINLHMDTIPFVPDLVQLDYELRPRLWVECGECSIQKLDKLAVKVPDAEIWVVRRSRESADDLIRAMARAGLRRKRYQVLGFDGEMFDEVCSLIVGRNEFFWVKGGFNPPEMQFVFNGLWFETAMAIVDF